MGQWLGSLMRKAAAIIGMPTQQESSVLDDLILRLKSLEEWDNKIMGKVEKLKMEIIERKAMMDDDPKFRTDESTEEWANEIVVKLSTISIELAERHATWVQLKEDVATKFKKD